MLLALAFGVLYISFVLYVAVTKNELAPKEPAAQHLQLTHHKHQWMNYAKSVGRFAHKMCQMGFSYDKNVVSSCFSS